MLQEIKLKLIVLWSRIQRDKAATVGNELNERKSFILQEYKVLTKFT